MSGAELMNSIEARTSGQWRPSPGSIYPILKWLVDKELIKIESVIEGEKRYLLTEDGAEFLEEAKKFKNDFISRMQNQKSLIHQMFHDVEEERIYKLTEEIYAFVAEKRERAKEDVEALLEELRDRLREV